LRGDAQPQTALSFFAGEAQPGTDIHENRHRHYQPHRLNEVRDALTAIGVHGMTITEVKGYGHQKGHTEIYRGAEYEVTFLPKTKIEVAVASDQADKAVEAIATAAKTGKIGDGKIFVLGLDSAMRIRTGETDASAL